MKKIYLKHKYKSYVYIIKQLSLIFNSWEHDILKIILFLL